MVNFHLEIVALGLNVVESKIHARLPAPSRQPASVAGCRAFGLYPVINVSYFSELRRGEEVRFHRRVVRLQPRSASPQRSRRAGCRTER